MFILKAQTYGLRVDTDKGYVFGEASTGKPYNYTILLEGNGEWDMNYTIIIIVTLHVNRVKCGMV